MTAKYEAPDGLSQFTAVRRTSPTQQVREQLLEAIERGDIAPGAILPSERVLCETFGVSRVSVREALAGLEAMKIIEIRHGRGAFVRRSINEQYAEPFAKYLELHRDELIELNKVRGALDELAAAEVAEHATEEGLAEIERAAAAFAAAASADQPNIAEVSRLDVEFHLSIARATGGELLPRLLGELNDVMTESRPATFSHEGQLARSIKDHQAVVAALRSRDAAKARKTMQKHMAAIRDWYEDLPAKPGKGDEA
ncbi:FadR family transcriptional regulator [Actinomadura barringtoniae]|uniref:FadR family transcriptional regulator n=1 Tax=Actinomadura barringtoniae TaxID=1427535 RepID=A0A939PNY9_9ACTN|nr:FadR/GntR family transcriptional regulator [Actinomadura barringtoniae]MBO2455735.1 FadR family transcriptional regulator [Actinomadura barringtoniae]